MNDNKEVMAMLQQISSKLDIVDSKVDEIQREAVKAGAKAGALTGAAAGGVAGAVAAGLACGMGGRGPGVHSAHRVGAGGTLGRWRTAGGGMGAGHAAGQVGAPLAWLQRHGLVPH